MKVKKDMIIMDIIKEKPEAHRVMVEFGLHCIGCGGAAWESLQDGAKAHGMEDKQIDEMIEKINELK